MLKKVAISVICILLLIGGYGLYYLTNDYNSQVDVDLLKKSLSIVYHEDYIEIAPQKSSDELAIVMYGGGNVEVEAYLETLAAIAEKGYKTFIVKVPFNMAILNMDAAETVLRDNEEIDEWVLMGHSLGGVAAARFAENNDDHILGLILMASYPEEDIDLSNNGVKVLSLFGSQDAVMDLEKIEASKSRMPESATFYGIEGGNHSQFGNYGFQKGDGVASITYEEQKNLVVDAINDFLEQVRTEDMRSEADFFKSMDEGLGVSYIDQSQSISIRALGDIMFHGPQVRAAELGDGYDFNPNFENIKDYLSDADLTIANLETTLSGEGKGYSGYPRFNTPDEALLAIEGAGIDVLSIANNHIADRGVFGYDRTLEMIENSPMTYIGGIEEDGDSQFKIIDVNGSRIAMIGATYETPLVNGKRTLNGSFLDEKIQDRLMSFQYDQLEVFYERIQSEMDLLQDVDLKIMMIHWGNEYWLSKNDHQKRIAKGLSDLGFDIVLGSHPHVIEEIEWIDETLVVYSMGNFISNQSSETTGKGHTEDGMIIHIERQVDRYGASDGLTYSVIPTWVDKYTDGQYRVEPVFESLVAEKTGRTLDKYLLSLERHNSYYKDPLNYEEFNNDI